MRKTKHLFVWLPLAVVVFLLASLAVFTNKTSAAGEFTTTWQTDIENTGDTSITIPIYLNPRYSYSYTVDWGDGTVKNYGNQNATHTYSEPGIYQVKISGNYPRIYLANRADAHKLVSIDSWGDNEWQSMARAFEGARNMTINATDLPNTVSVDNFSFAFKDAAKVTGGVANWNVSNATDFRSMFENASSFNESLGDWNVANMTLATSIFTGSGMTTTTYDATLRGWETTAAQQNVDISPVGLSHCQAASSVEFLTNTLNWIILDEGQNTSLCGPSNLVLDSESSQVIEENISNVIVGTLRAVDIEQDQFYTYSVGCSQSSDNSFFTVSGNDLVLTTALDYEKPEDDNADNTYTICVSATDSDGYSTQREFEIRISDVEETENENGIVDEGSVLGTSTNNVSLSDTEGGQVLGASSDEGAVLAETGQTILLALSVGTGLSAITIILIRKTRRSYLLNK